MTRVVIWDFLLLPLIIAAGVILWQGVPDAVCDGDAALIEIAARAALEGDQFTGPYSRGGFHHPGPFYFYVLAPLYWITNSSALSLHVTAIFLNMLSIAGMLVMVWHYTNRWTFIWFALLLSYYINYLGPTTLMSIWNPHVTILAFLVSVFCFAAVAMGQLKYLPITVVTSSFVVQTHLGYLPAITVIAAGSLMLFALPNIRKILGINTSNIGNVLHVTLMCVALFAILWALPCFEELSESPGNFSKIMHFFTEYSEEHSWEEVYRTSYGIFSNYVVSMFKKLKPWELSSQGDIPWFIHVVIWGQGILLIMAYFIARRQHQNYFIGLSLLCGVLYVSMVVSIKHIVGPILDYLLIWMTTLGMLTWLIIGGVIFQPLERRMRSVFGNPFRWFMIFLTAFIFIGITFVSGRTFFNASQHLVQSRYTKTDTSHIVSTSLEFLQKKGVHKCLLRAIDLHLWPPLAGLALNMTKASMTAMVDPQWPAKYPSRYFPASVPGGMLLFCWPETGKRLQQFINLTLVAETQNCLVFWYPLTKIMEGSFPFETLPVFAFTYQGFSKTGYIDEHSFRWSSGLESTMVILLDKGYEYNVTLTAAIPRNVQAVTVLLNEHKITELAFPQEWRWQEFMVYFPAEYVKDVNEVTFRYVYTEPPENPRIEGRHGSLVAFKSVSFEKTHDFY